eukprot:CAMPEP_0202700424 /NCGR_PEP_ID=MMETSP1385-20130828/13592_1 /ASSEMBLY_ACC=CAM_ASM_000861 /TAXON_ID=933848 /ORGANISM="Elphidium margaritaceum" /LENGTH=611 /DNA_ID=CAMNT_0049357599 /DNA_START=285 /DNA_END=2120 /DNA_ORIENTATION=+
MCFQSILNESIAHLNTQLGIAPLSKHEYYKCEINPQRHLKFLIDWPGLRISNSPQTKREYEKKAKNWLNGRRAPNYAKTLFPWFVEEAEHFCEKTATKLFARNAEQRRVYYQVLIHKVLAQLLGASVSLNEQAKKAPFFCKNSIERKGKLKEILQSYAMDHQYAQGFPSCFEEGVDYFDKKSNRFFAEYRQKFICGGGGGGGSMQSTGGGRVVHGELLETLPALARPRPTSMPPEPMIKTDVFNGKREHSHDVVAEQDASTMSDPISFYGGLGVGVSGESNTSSGASLKHESHHSIKQEKMASPSPVRRLADSITFVSTDISEPLRKRRRTDVRRSAPTATLYGALTTNVHGMHHQHHQQHQQQHQHQQQQGMMFSQSQTNDAEVQFWKSTAYNLQQQLIAERKQRAAIEQERDRYTLIMYLLQQQSAKLLMNGTLNTLSAICAQTMNLKQFPLLNVPGGTQTPTSANNTASTSVGAAAATPSCIPQQTTATAAHNMTNEIGLNAAALHDLNIAQCLPNLKLVPPPPPPPSTSSVPQSDSKLIHPQPQSQSQPMPKIEAADTNELLKSFSNSTPQHGSSSAVAISSSSNNQQYYDEQVKQLLDIITKPTQQ